MHLHEHETGSHVGLLGGQTNEKLHLQEHVKGSQTGAEGGHFFLGQ